MTATMMRTIEERRQRWRSLYLPESSGQFRHIIRYPERQPDMPVNRNAAPENNDIIWSNYELMLENAEKVQDDSIPHVSLITGTEIFAEALGSKVHHPEGSMPFALPFITSSSQVKDVKIPELSTSPLARHFDLMDEMVKRNGGPLTYKPVDIQSPMDIAALLWDKNTLFIAMLDEPEAVLELAAKAEEILTLFLDEWFRRYGTSFVSHYPEYYMEGGVTLSEDEIGAVNPEMFEQFFLPGLTRLSERYGGMGIHCCADARHQWAGLKSVPGLRILNLCNTQEYAEAAYGFFGDTIAQYHLSDPKLSWIEGLPPEEWASHMPAEIRGVFEIQASNREEAAEISQRLL